MKQHGLKHETALKEAKKCPLIEPKKATISAVDYSNKFHTFLSSFSGGNWINPELPLHQKEEKIFF